MAQGGRKVSSIALRRSIRYDRNGVAALEFALIAPILFVLLAAVFDLARAFIVWEEVNNAAQAVAEAAEKLSVSPGVAQTSLTYTQMQTAMSSIYTQMPGLPTANNPNGLLTGLYTVTLSEVQYWPLCASTALTKCTAQTPYTLWSTNLQEGLPGHLMQETIGGINLLQRPCSELIPVAAFPNNVVQLRVMPDPILATGTQMVLPPQVVADVQYTFTPFFFFFLHSVTFYASAALPTPLGDTTQLITANPASSTSTVTQCPNPS
jgi:Flp pilus assembly protein TadG